MMQGWRARLHCREMGGLEGYGVNDCHGDETDLREKKKASVSNWNQ